MKITRFILTLAAALMLASCKVRIIVPEGGSVTTSSGAYSCASGNTCDIDIVDFFFEQTFVAAPAAGYTFKFWKEADKSFCVNSPNPCSLFTKGLDANDWLKSVMIAFLESDEIFYLEPVFEYPPDMAKYEKSCKGCHGTGAAGAPVAGNAMDWEPRIAKGIDALLASVKNGFGNMPPKGLCADCTDADFTALIKFMSTPAQ